MKALSASILGMLIVLVAAWVGLGSTATASDSALAAGTGSLTVSTVDAAGKPVAGALVNVFPSGSSTPAASGTSNSAGKITFSSLAAGNYTVTASKVITVGGFSYAIFGTASATVSSGLPSAVVVRLNRFAP